MRQVLTAGVCLAIGVGLGWWMGSAGDAQQVASLESEVATVEAERDGLERQLLEAEEAVRRARRRAPSAREEAERADPSPALAVDPVPGRTDAAPGDDAESLDATERRRRVDALRARIDTWFDERDGEAAVKALRELAALAPEGRADAMALALRINEDVNGRAELGLSRQIYYAGLGDQSVRELMTWSLTNESPPDFRVMAAYSLPWTQPADRTVADFVAALQGESDVRVQRALVANLTSMKRPEANALLESIFTEPGRDPVLRAQIATELAMGDDERVLRVIEQAAANDADARVREAARAALVARSPPASGFLVTGTLPASQAEAAGLKAGDIVVSYGGQETKSVSALRGAASANQGRESVALVVIRDGQEVSLLCRPGQLGVYGRDVEADER